MSLFFLRIIVILFIKQRVAMHEILLWSKNNGY